MITESDIHKAKILIIEDDKISIRMLEDILYKAGYNNWRSLSDPREARSVYQEFLPDIILLDINMPYLDGFQVMEQLKTFEPQNYLPVLMITQEEGFDIRLKALQSGAKDFLNKPYDRLEVLLRIHNMLEVWMLQNEVRNQNKVLEAKVLKRTRELYDTRLDVIHRLARAAEFRDQETGMHIIRMSKYCEALAKEIGMSDLQRELLLAASPLHDIGKIAIPDSILLKPGKLDPQEWEIMKTHTTIGSELLSGSHSAFMKMAANIALTHHEKWDGTGYPQGLKEIQIPLVGRICGLCDVFDALTSSRPYKKAWSFEEAIEEIKKEKGKHFDPALLESFLGILPEIKRIKNQNQDFPFGGESVMKTEDTWQKTQS